MKNVANQWNRKFKKEDLLPSPDPEGRRNMKAIFLVGYATLLLFVPPGFPLRCYTCLFPTISPLDCLKFATPCGPSQKCLTFMTKGHRGDLDLVIYKKTCGDPSLCGAHGIQTMLGINFTYSIFCCSTDLCNGVPGEFSNFWKLLIFTPLLFILLYLC